MADYVLTIASFMAVILCIIPGIFHIQNKNWGAIYMSFWVSLINLIIFINSILWANDLENKAPAYCYITAPLVNAAHFGILASAGCMIHTLHNYVVKPTLLTERVKRNQSCIDFVLSIIVPFILTGLSYLNAQYVYGIRPVLGCFIQASQTWVYIIVDGMWPVLISGIGCYFAARTAYTIISKGLEIQSLLKYTKSGLNTAKFYRLVLFCISFLIFAFPTACLTFFSNVTLKPYDFNEVHGNFNQPQTFKSGVTFVDYVKPLTGLFVFVFFGTGHDAKRAYLRWAKTMKLDLCYGYCLKLKKSNNKISSNATTNAAVTTTIGSFQAMPNNSQSTTPRNPGTPPMTNINNINKLSPPTKKSNFFSGHRTPTEQAQFDLTSGIRIRIDGLDTRTIANEEDLEKNDKSLLLKPAPAYFKPIHKTSLDDDGDDDSSRLGSDVMNITIHNDYNNSSSSTTLNNTPLPTPPPAIISNFVYDGDSFGIVSHIDALLSVYPEDEDLPIVQIVPPTPAFNERYSNNNNNNNNNNNDNDNNNSNRIESFIDNNNNNINYYYL